MGYFPGDDCLGGDCPDTRVTMIMKKPYVRRIIIHGLIFLPKQFSTLEKNKETSFLYEEKVGGGKEF